MTLITSVHFNPLGKGVNAEAIRGAITGCTEGVVSITATATRTTTDTSPPVGKAARKDRAPTESA